MTHILRGAWNGSFFVKQKMFLESKELPFSQSRDNYTLTLSIGIFNTQS